MPLLICLAVLPAGAAARVFHRFTWTGLAAVLAIAGSGAFQGWVLAGGPAGFAGTAYGQVALIKTALFVAALVLAAVNGLALTARLGGPDAAGARLRLRRSISIEAALGLMIVLTAAWLANIAPGADLKPSLPPSPLLAALALPALLAVMGAAWLVRPVPFVARLRSRQ